jgi:hypothetical protein
MVKSAAVEHFVSILEGNASDRGDRVAPTATRFIRPVTQPRPDVFLCHTGADKPWVEYLAERLESEQSEGQPIRVFLDKWDIDYGENILLRIEQGLKESRYFAMVLSPAFATADWPALEWTSQVYQDPAGRQGRILPIIRAKYDPQTNTPLEIPVVLHPLKYFDFSRDEDFEKEFRRLLAKIRGERPARGDRGTGPSLGEAAFVAGRAQPDESEESLTSNLLAVHQYPVTIWSDKTPIKDKPEVWKALKGKTVPPFLPHGGRLYSFWDPRAAENPFRPFLSGTDISKERPVDWLRDPNKAPLLIGLFNSALREHCFKLRIRDPKDDRGRYFCPIFDGRRRTFRWRDGAKPRTLAKMEKGPKGDPFGIHYAARMRFQQLREEAYLLIEPCWLFTTNGVIPMGGAAVTRFATAWGGRERNATVLRNVLMWGLLLSEGESKITIDVGGGILVLDSIPALASIRVGLSEDTIRLDTLLGGVGAGEEADELELDAVAALKMAGAIDDEEREPELDDDGGLPF